MEAGLPPPPEAPALLDDLSVLAGLLSRLLVFTVHTALTVVSPASVCVEESMR